MAIEITVEDGTGLADANSYVSLADFRLYAENRGKSLSIVDDVVSAQIIRAADYVELFAARFVGTKATALQALAWPRLDVGSPVDAPFLPADIIRAQIEVALAIASGLDPLPVQKGGARIKKRVIGPLETSYELSDDLVRIPLADKLIANYLKSAAILSTVRI